MLWIVRSAWRYRNEILTGVQVVAELRRSAKDFTREYIRRKLRDGLLLGLSLALFQIGLLLSILLLIALHPSLFSRLVASSVLWALTLYNGYRFFFVTVPEMRAVRRTLKGKVGYGLKYLLRISLVNEITQWNLLIPFLCLGLAFFTRSFLGRGISYFAPWVEAFRLLNALQ